MIAHPPNPTSHHSSCSPTLTAAAQRGLALRFGTIHPRFAILRTSIPLPAACIALIQVTHASSPITPGTLSPDKDWSSLSLGSGKANTGLSLHTLPTLVNKAVNTEASTNIFNGFSSAPPACVNTACPHGTELDDFSPLQKAT